ncbi:C40 family peptidase [Geomonas sp.]|uniref:C40 family peptidase n=1 Tax=Geomonas sp. TaxID=2651584 RepID=UPI002B48E296|nr:C40 family peptidase [Geomonas sp.]
MPEDARSRQNQASPLNSGFHSVLESLGDGAAAGRSRRAAAELFRMEMMQHSLSLFEDENSTPAPSVPGPLESLLVGVCADLRGICRQGSPAATTNANSSSLPEPAGGDQLPQEAESALDEIGKSAAEYLGIPYRFGGEGSNGIDCSSFVQHVFRQQGIELPRTAREQSRVGSDVEQGSLRKGDLLFFHTYASYPSHVGIYLGDGKMIHASSVKGEVTVSNLNTDYYRSRFMGAKRIV